MMKRKLKFGDVVRITFKKPNIQSWYSGFSAIFFKVRGPYSYMVKIYNESSKIKIESSDIDILAYIGSDDLLTYINIL